MKLATHVHTFHSGRSTICPLQNVLRESYEQRFNENLLFDLVARPAAFQAQIPGLAA